MAFIVSAPFAPDAYQQLMASFENDPAKAFIEISTPVLKRFYRQRERPAPTAAYTDAFLRLVWETVHREGVPSPLAQRDVGKVSVLSDEYLVQLADDLLGQLPLQRFPEEMTTFATQFLLSLLAAEFRTCRLSYQEKGPDGCVSRQSADHCQDRISGSHCEDCPFWTALSAAQSEKMLRKAWSSEDSFDDQLDLFLPGDFRSLRLFWYLYIRNR